MRPIITISNLKANVAVTPVLKGVNLKVNPGELHAIMGPNGSGKSTLAFVLAGHPQYAVVDGKGLFAGNQLFAQSPDQRAKGGLFLAFQYPVAVPGVSVGNFMRKSYQAIHGKVPGTFRRDLYAHLELVHLDRNFAARDVNEGFSGGEKKRLELVQMAMLKPKLVILDEIDSGLDIDGIAIVASAIKSFLSPHNAVIIITHYARILQQLRPDVVHVMQDGRIVKSGTYALAIELEKHGYTP